MIACWCSDPFLGAHCMHFFSLLFQISIDSHPLAHINARIVWAQTNPHSTVHGRRHNAPSPVDLRALVWQLYKYIKRANATTLLDKSQTNKSDFFCVYGEVFKDRHPVCVWVDVLCVVRLKPPLWSGSTYCAASQHNKKTEHIVLVRCWWAAVGVAPSYNRNDLDCCALRDPDNPGV